MASWWNLHQVLVVGAILHVGTDMGGRQASTLFGGNDVVRVLCDTYKIDTRKMLDELITAVKYIFKLDLIIVPH